MRGRRATKKELDDRPFNYPGKGENKQAKLKKMQGNSKHDNAKTAAAGLKFSCAVCRSALT